MTHHDTPHHHQPQNADGYAYLNLFFKMILRHRQLSSLLLVALRFHARLSSTTAFTLANKRGQSVSRHGSALGATDKPTVAIVGSGAVGAYYGSRLWETGVYDVKFHMRGEHYKKSSEDGLNVTSVNGDIFIPPQELQAYTETKDMGKADWVVVALKSSALPIIPELIFPLLEPGKTRVLAIMNGLIEEDLLQLLKEHAKEDSDDGSLHCCAALYGGMALVCSNRLGPGRIDHSYAGLLSGGVAAKHPDVSDEDNKKAYEELWEPAQIDIACKKSYTTVLQYLSLIRPLTPVSLRSVTDEPSILSGRWRKNVWNLPFNG